MNREEYLQIKERLIEAGYKDEIEWSANILPCDNVLDFFCEYAFVVINSGMKAQIARQIWEKVACAIRAGWSVHEVFGHKGKAAAIDKIWNTRSIVFQQYQKAEDKLAFLRMMPWIGDITKYHLAKNLGLDCVKPDRHLVRISRKYETAPFDLCKRLSEETGDKLATVDTVLWRAANLGMI